MVGGSFLGTSFRVELSVLWTSKQGLERPHNFEGLNHPEHLIKWLQCHLNVLPDPFIIGKPEESGRQHAWESDRQRNPKGHPFGWMSVKRPSLRIRIQRPYPGKQFSPCSLAAFVGYLLRASDSWIMPGSCPGCLWPWIRLLRGCSMLLPSSCPGPHANPHSASHSHRLSTWRPYRAAHSFHRAWVILHLPSPHFWSPWQHSKPEKCLSTSELTFGMLAPIASSNTLQFCLTSPGPNLTLRKMKVSSDSTFVGSFSPLKSSPQFSDFFGM